MSNDFNILEDIDKKLSDQQDQVTPYKPDPEELAAIEEIFKFHPVQPGQGERYEEIRTRAKWFATFILHNCPRSRERTIAIRYLQQTVMYANAAIAINEPTS